MVNLKESLTLSGPDVRDPWQFSHFKLSFTSLVILGLVRTGGGLVGIGGGLIISLASFGFGPNGGGVDADGCGTICNNPFGFTDNLEGLV
jgi:hypothetical protein